jgi:hypothetical protein
MTITSIKITTPIQLLLAAETSVYTLDTIPEIIEAKIMRDIPFDIPFSVIHSPIYKSIIAPTESTNADRRTRPKFCTSIRLPHRM